MGSFLTTVLSINAEIFFGIMATPSKKSPPKKKGLGSGYFILFYFSSVFWPLFLCFSTVCIFGQIKHKFFFF